MKISPLWSLLAALASCVVATETERFLLRGNDKDKDKDEKEKKNPFHGGHPKEELSVQGGRAKKAKPKDSGKDIKDLPGAKKLSSMDLGLLDAPSKLGR